MFLRSQLLKGILDGCVLAVILKELFYGYELSKKLQEFGLSDVSEGDDLSRIASLTEKRTYPWRNAAFRVWSKPKVLSFNQRRERGTRNDCYQSGNRLLNQLILYLRGGIYSEVQTIN